MARRSRRSRLATAAARPAAKPDRVEPTLRLAKASGAGPGTAILVACRRLAAGRKRRPTAAIVDTQSVGRPQRGPRDYDVNKKIKGRKRELLIEIEGDPLGVRGGAGRYAGSRRLARPRPGSRCYIPPSLLGLARPRLRRQRSARFPPASRRHPGDRRHAGRKGFQVEPRRWKVEQTFGCLQRYRRLRVDDETSNATSRHMTILASVFMTGMRLERMLQP